VRLTRDARVSGSRINSPNKKIYLSQQSVNAAARRLPPSARCKPDGGAICTSADRLSRADGRETVGGCLPGGSPRATAACLVGFWGGSLSLPPLPKGVSLRKHAAVMESFSVCRAGLRARSVLLGSFRRRAIYPRVQRISPGSPRAGDDSCETRGKTKGKQTTSNNRSLARFQTPEEGRVSRSLRNSLEEYGIR